MKEFIKDIRKSLDTENYRISLFATLALIDACANIAYGNNTGNRERYLKWLENYHVSRLKISNLRAEAIYAFRCSLLHEGGHKINSSKTEVKNICLVINTGSNYNYDTKKNELMISIELFTKDILESVEKWIENTSDNKTSLDFKIQNKTWSTAGGGFHNNE